MWKKVLREYFAFPKKERRGLFVLFTLWFILLGYSFYQSKEMEYILNTDDYTIIVSEELKYYDARVLDSSNKSSNFSKKIYPKYLKYMDEKSLNEIGLSKLQIKKVVDLQKNGSPIYTKLDFENSKELDTILKQILLPHLKFFPEKKYFDKNYLIRNQTKQIQLNTADTNEIDAIRGVSKSMSLRIYKYRERLGGYLTIEQLKEVWGMDSATYVQLQQYVLVNSAIKKININTAEVKELGAHPYIGYSLAKLIVNYRLQHGEYNKIEDLFEIHVMNADIFSKIEAYITTGND